MELWTLRRENKGARSKNSPGIDPCRPSDFSTQVWGSLFKAPLYSPNNNKCIDTGLTSGPPWGDGAEEAGEQQEQGHLSDPVAKNRVEIPLTLFFLCSFFKYLGENSLWTLRERPNGAAQELTALDLAPDRGLLSTANSAVVLMASEAGKTPPQHPSSFYCFLFFFSLKNSLSYPEGNSY